MDCRDFPYVLGFVWINKLHLGVNFLTPLFNKYNKMTRELIINYNQIVASRYHFGNDKKELEQTGAVMEDYIKDFPDFKARVLNHDSVNRQLKLSIDGVEDIPAFLNVVSQQMSNECRFHYQSISKIIETTKGETLLLSNTGRDFSTSKIWRVLNTNNNLNADESFQEDYGVIYNHDDSDSGKNLHHTEFYRIDDEVGLARCSLKLAKFDTTCQQRSYSANNRTGVTLNISYYSKRRDESNLKIINSQQGRIYEANHLLTNAKTDLDFKPLEWFELFKEEFYQNFQALVDLDSFDKIEQTKNGDIFLGDKVLRFNFLNHLRYSTDVELGLYAYLYDTSDGFIKTDRKNERAQKRKTPITKSEILEKIENHFILLEYAMTLSASEKANYIETKRKAQYE